MKKASVNVSIYDVAYDSGLPMKKAFVSVILYPCGQCNWPLVVLTYTNKQHEELANFGTSSMPIACDRCKWMGTLKGIDAVALQAVPWNFEIKSFPGLDFEP